MISPHQIASKGSEHAHQAALFAWAAISGIPELKWLHAIPNGGERNAIVAGNMKAEGVRAGVYDIFLPVPCGRYAGLYIEMKKPGREREKNGGLSDKQIEFRDFAIAHAYATCVHYSWETAAEAIRSYLAHGAA